MKYTDTEVTFIEFPNEISLCINISGCPYRCKNCHSPELQKDIGTELTKQELARLIESNKGISCVGFMGGDSNPSLINTFASFISNIYPDIKVGWYSGHTKIPVEISTVWFDYIKIGPYIEEYGPLNNPNTNQRLYEVNRLSKIPEKWDLKDITYKFWK